MKTIPIAILLTALALPALAQPTPEEQRRTPIGQPASDDVWGDLQRDRAQQRHDEDMREEGRREGAFQQMILDDPYPVTHRP